MFKVFKNPLIEANGFTSEYLQQIKDKKPRSWLKHWEHQQFIPDHFFNSEKLKPAVDKSAEENYIYPIFFDPVVSSMKENVRLEYFDLPTKILKDIESGKCKLYIDHSSEGYDVTYHMKGFDDLTHDMICNTSEVYGIDHKNIFLGSANLKCYTNVPYNVIIFNGTMFWTDAEKSQE